MKITMYKLLGEVKDEPDRSIYVKYFDRINKKEDVMWACKKNIIYKLNQLIIDLNDEVEIIKETRGIPEKLDIRQEKNIKNNWKWKVYGKEHSYNISTPQKIIADKINEIIDYLKSKGE